MPSKSDITAYKVTPKNILSKTQEDKQAVQVSKPGKKPLLARNKRSEAVTIKLTPSERNLIEQKAGLVPMAVYLQEILSRNTDIFKQ